MPRNFPPTLLVLLALSACGSGRGSASDGHTNVLLLVSDDQGLVLGCYGEPGVQTPNLDLLAGEGLRFISAYATCAVCTPSRSALYTGRYAVASGVTGFGPVAGGVPVWGEVLAEAGYRTGLIGKLGARPIARFPFDFSARTSPDDPAGRSVAWHVGALQEFLGQDDGRPFCLVVNFRDSHYPFPSDGAPTGWPGDDVGPQDPSQVRVPPQLVDTPAVRAELAAYQDGLRRMDTTVGALLGVLGTFGRTQDTLVLFTSDNGPPWPFAKTTLYEAGVHMPLLARWPGVVEPGTEERMVSLLDLLPTVLELAPRQVSLPLDGRSLVPLLRGEPGVEVDWREFLFTSHTGHRREPEVPSRAVRMGDWKYIRNLRPELRFENAVMLTSVTWRAMVEAAATDPAVAEAVERFQLRPAEELYHLDVDPHEQVNLAGDPQHGARLEQLRRRLREHLEEIGDPLLAEW